MKLLSKDIQLIIIFFTQFLFISKKALLFTIYFIIIVFSVFTQSKKYDRRINSIKIISLLDFKKQLTRMLI